MRQAPQRPQPTLDGTRKLGCSQGSEEARTGFEGKRDVDSQAHFPALPSLRDPALSTLPPLVCLQGFKQNTFVIGIECF